jgi:RsiW-degrading membrane proteinase PrsW (M82 family)
MNYPFYIFLAALPSTIWLLFYLRKDVHPESNRMILKIFFYGMLAALPAILLETGFLEGLKRLNLSPVLVLVFNIFIGVAFVEEFLKYLVVRGKVFKSSELDEPLDIMLYMIIAALGFAAFENILILFSLGSASLLREAISITIFRFLGATFLHALCSGTLGYFIALSFYETKKRLGLLILGLGIATSLHGFYNFSIIEIEGNLKFLIPTFILLSLAIFVTFGFKRLKKIKSICLPNSPSASLKVGK